MQIAPVLTYSLSAAEFSKHYLGNHIFTQDQGERKGLFNESCKLLAGNVGVYATSHPHARTQATAQYPHRRSQGERWPGCTVRAGAATPYGAPRLPRPRRHGRPSATHPFEP